MTVMPFIPKEDKRLPDCWGIKIFYVDGKVEEFEGIHFSPIRDGIFEFATFEGDIRNYVVLSSVKRIEFDERFSKFLALRKEFMERKDDTAS